MGLRVLSRLPLKPSLLALCAALAFFAPGPPPLRAQSYSFTTVFGFGGLSDGVAAKARFYAKGIAVDRAGNIYIGDGQGFYVRGSTLRKLMPIGTNFVVSTLAGQAGTPGLVNGWGSQAKFAGLMRIGSS